MSVRDSESSPFFRKQVPGEQAPRRLTETPPSNFKAPVLFHTRGATLGSVMRFVGEPGPEADDAQRQAFDVLYRRHRHYLEAAVGLVSAWIGDRYPGDPQAWARPATWQEPLAQLPSPLYIPLSAQEGYFQQDMRGVELSGSLFQLLANRPGAGKALGEFNAYLSSLGERIHGAMYDVQDRLETYHVALNYQPQREPSGHWQLQSSADIYFVTLSKQQPYLYQNCRSAAWYPFEFRYVKMSLLLNPGAAWLPSHAPEREDWDRAIAQSRVDHLDQDNFFYEGFIRS